MESQNKRYHRLTHPQKRIWYIDEVHEGSQLHNIGGCLNIHDDIDVAVMQRTLNLIIEKNDALRIRINKTSSDVNQYVEKFSIEDIDFLDFSGADNPNKEFSVWLDEVFKKPFTIYNSKLYYFAIYKLSDKEFGVLVKLHHIISDGWSLTLVQNQICDLYENLLNSRESDLQFNSYIDYIKAEDEYLSSERFNKNKNFWLNKFVDIPEDFLYTSANSVEGQRLTFDIDEKLSKSIKDFAKDTSCSLNTFFIAILFIFLKKTINKNDLILGTPVFNRTSKEQKGMIGMFTSTVPVRVSMEQDLTFKELIKLVNRELRLCFLHQRYPYDLLVKDLELTSKGYDSLFKMCVNYYNSVYDSKMNDIDVDVTEYYSGNQSYSLQLVVKEWDSDFITLNFDYKVKEYKKSQIKAMYHSLINIVKQVISHENVLIDDINLIDDKEFNFKIKEFNSTSFNYPVKTVAELFENQVIKTPDKIAVEFNDTFVTYQELNQRANRLANYLKDKINKGSIVAIMQEHDVNLMVSILACLKLGVVYLPIDPVYPKDRVNYIISDASCSLLLTNFDVDINSYDVEILNVCKLDLTEYGSENLLINSSLNDVVYIIYTSGSTGKPKGVMVKQKGLTNYICWANRIYLKQDDVMALYSSIAFDLTVTSIFTPLISGNKLVIYGADEDNFVLYKILDDMKATVIKLTPSHLALLKDFDYAKSKIRRMIVGGDDLKVSLAKDIYNSFGQNIEIFNEYGPTEAVVGCMIYKYDVVNDTAGSVPIGKPIDNAQIYLLDENLNYVPTGFDGELYVSGVGVAKGYLNRSELTKEKFVDNPFIDGQKMYKTGDVARFLENGNIEYVGRVGNQVKIRGYRIELGEIENCLQENQAVKDVVVVSKDIADGGKIINAYLVLESQVTDAELKKWLLKYLPSYMLPTNYIYIDNIPLTVNGKIDVDLLPEPEEKKHEFVESETVFEKELVTAIEQVLGVKNVSLLDNYNGLGGDSVKAIQISARLKNVGLSLKVKDILAYETIKEIAECIEKSDVTISVNQGKSVGEIENTPIINWFFNQKLLNENHYNQNVKIVYNNGLDVEHVRVVIDKLLEHHDALRIRYNRSFNKLYYADDLSVDDVLMYYDLSNTPNNEQDNLFNRINMGVNNGIDIEKDSLFKVSIIKLNEHAYVLLFTAHHLLVDGVSWRIILEDFMAILKQVSVSEEIKLPLKTLSYKEWSKMLIDYSLNNFDDEIVYWNSILGKEFTYHDKGKENDATVETVKVVSEEIEQNIVDSLILQANEIYGIDLNDVLIIALVITLNKITKQSDIVLEIERHGREELNESVDISRTVGWFTSMFPILLNVGDKNLSDNIKSLKEQLKNIPNQGFNYSVLQHISDKLHKNEPKRIRFNYLGDFDNILAGDSARVSVADFGLSSDLGNHITSALDVSAIIINKKLKIMIEYSKNLFNDDTIHNMIKVYVETLNIILDDCSSHEEKEFTPSDFDAVEISQDDLDSLFG